jgi:hypothetical protein
VIVVADKDAPGRAHAAAIAADLDGKAKSVVVLEAAEGKDVTDHLGAGRRLDELVPPRTVEPLPPQQNEWDAAALMQHTFPERHWAVPGLLPPGLGMLSAPPKVGKSFWILGVAIATVTGRPALGTFPTDPGGDVLFLALEDGAQRIQQRLRLFSDAARLTAGMLTVRTVSPRLDDGGLDEIVTWIEEHRDRARLVVIDVFQAMRSSKDGKGKANVYSEDYQALSGLRAVANRYGVAIVVVHHNNKGRSEDPLMLLSGSTGLSGVVDYVAVIKRNRNEAEGSVFIVGRDVEDVQLAMTFDGGRWTVIDYPVGLLAQGGTRKLVYDAVAAAPAGLLALEVAEQLGLSVGAASKALDRLATDGLVERLNSPAPGQSVRWTATSSFPSVSCTSRVSGLSSVSTATQDTQDTPDTKVTQDTQDSDVEG